MEAVCVLRRMEIADNQTVANCRVDSMLLQNCSSSVSPHRTIALLYRSANDLRRCVSCRLPSRWPPFVVCRPVWGTKPPADTADAQNPRCVIFGGGSSCYPHGKRTIYNTIHTIPMYIRTGPCMLYSYRIVLLERELSTIAVSRYCMVIRWHP